MDQPIAKYFMAMDGSIQVSPGLFPVPGLVFQFSATRLPSFNRNFTVKTVMDWLRSLKRGRVPKDINQNLFDTIGLNVEQCHSPTPQKIFQGPNNRPFATFMNYLTFVRLQLAILEAYYDKSSSHFTEDIPNVPLKFYDFVNGSPNDIPNNAQSLIGMRTFVLEYGTRVQLTLQYTGTIRTENHPIQLHGYSFNVVGYGMGNYNPQKAKFNLAYTRYTNVMRMPVGGRAVRDQICGGQSRS